VNRYLLSFLWLAASLAVLTAATAMAQTPSPSQLDAITVEGTVRNSAGEPVTGASVILEEKSGGHKLETKTDAGGKFSLIVRHEGIYTVTVEKAGFGKCVTDPIPLSAGQKKQIELQLQTATAAPCAHSLLGFAYLRDAKPDDAALQFHLDWNPQRGSEIIA
jgi:hypothetical protein